MIERAEGGDHEWGSENLEEMSVCKVHGVESSKRELLRIVLDVLCGLRKVHVYAREGNDDE